MYEPNDSVEVDSTEVTTVLSPPRRASIGSTYNSGEDIATTPCIIGSGWKTKIGTAGFTVVDCQVHHTFQTSTGRLVAMCSHKRKSSLDTNVFQESHSERESKGFVLCIEKSTIFFNGKQIRPPKVNRQL